MIPGTLIVVAVLLGYTVAVTCALAATFGLTSLSPKFVVRGHHISGRYKRLQSLIWLLCVSVGASVTCAVAQGLRPWMTGAALAALLISMLWFNTSEARQRGLVHQIAMSFTSIAGVIAGFEVAGHLLKIG